MVVGLLFLWQGSPAHGASVGELLKEMVEQAKELAEAVTVEALAEQMAGEGEFKLVDVRTEAEFEAGHLRGAVWVPRGKLEFIASRGGVIEVEDEIVVYCKRDGRASLAAATLKKLGFKTVKYLEDGFEEWVNAGQTIYNQHGELTVEEFEKEE
jgi:rhodanese-related sulfurtransferase